MDNPSDFTWEDHIIVDQHEKEQLLTEKKLSITEQHFSLKKLKFDIKKGELVAFVGENGSGKSSIIYAILGEMLIRDKKLSLQDVLFISGSLSFVQQEPWIIQGTIKYNIVLDQEFDLQRYKQAIFYSALVEDLEQLKNGDQTEIAEKGDTLSGGQRKRIALARSIYKNSDIIIMDNVLSALDFKVVDFVMESCIMKHLRHKTRIMIQNNLNNLQKVDRIFIIKDGQIQFEGNYD